jgi:non-specific serine/threonine protein kinase/serine/threonine-protein kinase
MERPPRRTSRHERDDRAPQPDAEHDAPTQASTRDHGTTGAPPGQSDVVEDQVHIPHHRIQQRLGEGGMGQVFLAEQLEPVRRQVAVKVIKLGMDTRSIVNRFEAERQALARMEHASIAHVYEAGVTERGSPYFSMEYVSGEPITDYCDNRRLNVRERLELFIQVCNAIQHAHQKGVIHRDLKPSNILVVERNEGPLPKVIDFGIAKATRSELEGERTLVGQVLGTPGYMSPEQALSGGRDIDTRSDVYSLGTVLYELLTGRMPFDADDLLGGGVAGLQALLRENDPPTPSRRLRRLGTEAIGAAAEARATLPPALLRWLRGDLDWIVMRALERDPERRYETANALSLDIHRFLTHEAVRARPTSAAYRTRKFVRRHRVGVLMASTVAILIVAGLAGTAMGFVEARREAIRANTINTFLTETISEARPDRAQGREVTVREMVDRMAGRIEEDFAEQPEVEAELAMTIGNLYTHLGQHEDAEQQLRRAHALFEELAGQGSWEEIRALNLVALNDLRRSDYAAAEPIFERVHQGLVALRGADDPETLTASHNLGAALLGLERFEEASEVLERTLAGRRRALGDEHAQTLATLSNLAQLYKDTGRIEKAEPLYREVLDIRRRELGERHPRTLISVYNLGDLCIERDLHEEADEHFATASRGFEEVFGADHPYTLLALMVRAENLTTLGRYEEAERVGLDAWQRHVARYGQEHDSTRELAGVLAELYEARGDHAKAERWSARADG